MCINEKMIYIIDNENNKEIIDADWNEVYGLLIVQRNLNKLEVILNDKTLYLSFHIDYPMIRWIDNNLFILADARNEDGKNNLFILDIKGNLRQKFNCGDALTDINVCKEGIWFSYFDEGIFGKGISNQGLVLFNLDGLPIFKYNSQEKMKPKLWDCDAMCHGSASSIWVLSQVDVNEYKLINVNHKKDIVNVFTVPEILNQFNAISIRGDNAYFYSTFQNVLFSLQLSTGKMSKLSTLSGKLRGIKNSQTNLFISIQSSTVKLVTINQTL